MNDESFADAPQSLAEARAEKARNAALWAPREALVAMLRDIDTGKLTVDMVVIAHGTKQEDGSYRPGFFSAGGENKLTALGLLSAVSWIMNEG